jgi:hypothetical protein
MKISELMTPNPRTVGPDETLQAAARTRAVTTRPLEAGVGRRIGLVWRRNYPRVRDIHSLAETLRDHLPKSVHRV